ncbi:MAG: glycosyltransferase, partial [Gemmatimonadota bacterium]
YNRLAMLQTFVRSVRRGLVPAGARDPLCSYEIVVADGGSTDGTLAWLAEQSDIRMVHGGLTGAIDAFNAAYETSRGEFVMHANDDTEVVGDSVAAAVEHLRAHPEDASVVFQWSRDGGKTWKHDGSYGKGIPPHPNQAVTRRLALEDCIAHELGAFWGDAAHRTDKTYGGDSYQWVVLARRGWRAVSLGERCRILDKMNDATDALRAINAESVGPGSYHSQHFHAMSRIGAPGCWDLELPADRWPQVYVAEPGRAPRRSPIAAGPQERVLVLHMGWGPEPLTDLRRAFARIGPCEDVAWVDAMRAGGPEAIRAAVLGAAGRVRPTFVWAQIQRPGQFPPGLMADLRQACGPDCLLIVWNGDVRTSGTQPMEEWQADLGRQVDLYLVSNCTQPLLLAREGIRAGYLPVGYDPVLSDYRRDAGPQQGENGAIFAGQNYHRLDGGYRQRLFDAVERAHPGRLTLFGGGWGQSPALKPLMGGPLAQEPISYVYSRARVGVACSLFTDLRRYTSDRLKRMLGCGAVTALRAFDDYEGLGIRDGVHALVWRDEQDLVDLLGDWLRPERDRDRPRIREAAWRLARGTMTWDVIVENLLAIVRAERHRRATP